MEVTWTALPSAAPKKRQSVGVLVGVGHVSNPGFVSNSALVVVSRTERSSRMTELLVLRRKPKFMTVAVAGTTVGASVYLVQLRDTVVPDSKFTSPGGLM